LAIWGENASCLGDLGSSNTFATASCFVLLFLQLLHFIFLATASFSFSCNCQRLHFKAIVRAFELVSVLFWWI